MIRSEYEAIGTSLAALKGAGFQPVSRRERVNRVAHERGPCAGSAIMLVEEVMTPDPFVVDTYEPIARIAELIRRHRIHQVPVIDENNRIVGIVTDRDIRSASGANSDTAGLLARDVMTTNVVSVSPTQPLADAVRILCEHRFGSLPVVVGERIVGILSTRDLLRRLLVLLEQSAMRTGS